MNNPKSPENINQYSELFKNDVLIIDDEQSILKVISRFLGRRFAKVYIANEMEAGIETINNQLRPGSLIISDFDLYQGEDKELSVLTNGLTIAQITRQIRSAQGMSFILHSGGTKNIESQREISNALSSGLIDAFLPKPADFNKILETAERIKQSKML